MSIRVFGADTLICWPITVRATTDELFLKLNPEPAVQETLLTALIVLAVAICPLSTLASFTVDFAVLDPPFVPDVAVTVLSMVPDVIAGAAFTVRPALCAESPDFAEQPDPSEAGKLGLDLTVLPSTAVP